MVSATKTTSPKANGSNSNHEKQNTPNSLSFTTRFFTLLLLLCSIAMLFINHNIVLTSGPQPHDSNANNSMEAFTELHKKLQDQVRNANNHGNNNNNKRTHYKEKRTDKKNKQKTDPNQHVYYETSQAKWGTLQCDAYGGPSPEIAQEMVYWSDVPSDASYKSPFHAKRGQHKRYMTFEPDGGGWNNIRMAMETVFAMAHAMGRTLVMPPQQRMYLLGKQQNRQRTHFGFADFFPIEELAQEHVGLEIISMKQFLEAEAMTGNLLDKYTGKPSFPPDNNRTDWDGQPGPQIRILKEWLRNVTHVAMWRPPHCVAVFPSDTNAETTVQQLKQDLANAPSHFYKAENNPIDVTAPPLERLIEMLSGRRELCVYDEEMQNAMVVHFMCYHKLRIRLLVHFYCFLFFQDWKQDLWTKRFIRDHVRYVDEIQCAAARVVHAIRQRAASKSNTTEFDSFHIRRGDFQFKTTRVSAQEIYSVSKAELTEGSTVYIATDERNKTFFNPLGQHYDVVFLDDFMDEIKGLNTNYYGMLDQLVASRGRSFFGCWFSTFTGYITRMRGYHSVKDKLAGYRDGLLPNTYYYTTKDKKHAMMTYNFWNTFAREFPTSWRNINTGIGMLPGSSLVDDNSTTVATQ